MFSDRFLRLKVAAAALLLWGGCLYSRFAGEARYPSFEDCLNDPARLVGHALGLRAMPVLAVSDGGFVVADAEGRVIPVRMGGAAPEWVGQHVTFVGRFEPAADGRPAGLAVETDAAGRPRLRLEPRFPRRRLLMYGVSAAVALAWGWLFLREFRVTFRATVLRKGGGPSPTS